VQSSTNPNGKQQPGRNRKKGQGNNCKGGINNKNAKDNANNDRLNNNVGECKKEKGKVKFPCKLCKDDHLTHLFPKLEESLRLLSQPPVVLTNPFPHNHHMDSSSSHTKNVSSGNQNPPAHEGDHLCVNMVKDQIDVATRSCGYGSSHRFSRSQSLPLLPKHICRSKS
jgi:hypothetical protein